MAEMQRTASNTFTEGLVMDFNPSVTKSEYLVNALNATFLTFNGNEMALQQDMGNGRVETAFLPEGYVPVGTCSYGNIIYIVSYNPLENKSQIGCFPSPERNISTEEVSKINQEINSGDFQEIKDNSPTGKLKATSIKRILFGNKNLNPGDKFIIYEDSDGDSSTLASAQTLTDYGNTSNKKDEWPKLINLKIVAIEDSGKIVDLGATVKWYENDYYLSSTKKDTNSKPDIDDYRKTVSSAYSIFQSKVSGKLAILAELESIKSFSHSYEVFAEKTEDSKVKYTVVFYTNWESDHNDINPKGIVFTKSQWKNSEDAKVLIPTLENENIVYKESPDGIKLPKKVDFKNGKFEQTDALKYSTLYDLENPSATFNAYKSSDSYNAKIKDIVDWKKVDDTYSALKDQSKYTNLRTVTKITPKLDKNSGLPEGKQSHKYFMNLDRIELVNKKNSKEQELKYSTKGIDGSFLEIDSVDLTDDVVNNYFHKSVIKKLEKTVDVSLSTKLTINGKTVELPNDLSNLIWEYELAPSMPYGVLENFSQSGVIEFSKVGTGEIKLTDWRYYNSGNVSNLIWGIECHPEPNKGISEVVLEFYDNQGFACAMHSTGKSSYSGIFNDNIILGKKFSDYRFNNVNAKNEICIHAGTPNANGNIYLDSNNKPTLEKPSDEKLASVTYLDDCGTLYPNILYFVKIIIKYGAKDALGNFTNTENTSKIFYRWFWSNSMFNDNFYSERDFDDLKPQLSMDFSAKFQTNGANGTNPLSPEYTEYYKDDYYMEGDNKKVDSTLGANIYHINQNYEDDEKGNISFSITPSLFNNYQTFNFQESGLKAIKEVYLNMGKSSITKNVDEFSVDFEKKEINNNVTKALEPVIATKLDDISTNNWERAGYIGSYYGANKSKINEKLIKQIQKRKEENPNRQDTETLTDTIENKVEGKEGVDMYDPFEDSINYALYKDSFSLNIAGDKEIKKEPIEYLNSNSEKITINKYLQQKLSLLDAWKKGFKLVLTGISFSKIAATDLKSSPDSKILRSTIYNLSENIDGYSIKNLGFHLYENNLCFNTVMTWQMGDSVGRDSHMGSSCGYNIKDGSWKKDEDTNTEHTWYDTDTDRKVVYLGEDKVQELMRPSFKSAICAFIPSNLDSDSESSAYQISTDYTANFGQIKEKFGLRPGKNNQIFATGKGDIMPKNLNAGNNNGYLYSFIVNDSKRNLLIIISDWFLGQYKKQINYSDKPVTKTLANMLGSLFAQLYVEIPTSNKIKVLDNIVKLNPYIESWNKDLIVTIKTENLSEEEINKLLTIQSQGLDRYLNLIEINSLNTGDKKEEIKKSNVKFKILNSQRVIQFKFDVPYNLGNLHSKYLDKTKTQNVIFLSELDEKGNPVVKSFLGKIDPSVVYTWTGFNISQLNGGSLIYYADEFIDKNSILYMTYKKTNTMKTASFNTLSQIIKCENGEIKFYDLRKMKSYDSVYKFRYEADQDTRLEGIPKISFFNEYKPF